MLKFKTLKFDILSKVTQSKNAIDQINSRKNTPLMICYFFSMLMIIVAFL